MKAFKKGFLVVLTVCLLSSLTACNTVHGVGKDVQKGGQVISRAAS